MAMMNTIITAQGEEFPLQGMTLVLRHLALEGDQKTSVYLITKDEDDKEVKVLLATLSSAVPQHSCEIPITGETVKLICEGKAKVHAILTPELEEDFDDFDMEGMSEEEDDDNGEFAEEGDDDEEDEDEKPVEAPKKVEPKKEEKKPQQPKKEEKKPQQPPKKETKPQQHQQPKKEEKKPQQPPKKEFNKKEGKKMNKKNNKKH
ncbi:hypothetical protein, conserved [Entamoeba dispar SAW760]|uniref:Nucleoplasmin-like domain-containing protein n=1 Tax=Entamoeba dispar (strain ATCC PRA-260 / SAW760) TaxID=370354 RepID=B0EC42_ENTDS|nr:uncharacterized protein EDI_125160 [Entamoeba dispar SAW760]EDR27890.1 hypothetical protein, conserved [Entamoeba dispar SAW760]|eukprot:EDR27890.1 hypothetical protein, conserved [Entamoeba dispar SAW760]